MEDLEKIDDLAMTYGPNIAAGLLLIVLAVLLAVSLRFILRRFLRKYEWATRVGNLIAATAYYTILTLGLLTGLSTMGMRIAPIIAGLGLGGFALGFALRDALSNLLAGVLIIIYQPFKEGDTVSVSGCRGVVIETNLRYTVLEDEHERFMVPNSLIFKNPLKIALTNDKEKP